MNDQDDEDRLEAYFAAARAESIPARAALYTAILADAAAARVPAPAPRRRHLPWGAASALAACAALGFWVGLVGTGDYGGTAYPSVTAASDDAAAPVDAFFDLASVEG